MIVNLAMRRLGADVGLQMEAPCVDSPLLLLKRTFVVVGPLIGRVAGIGCVDRKLQVALDFEQGG